MEKRVFCDISFWFAILDAGLSVEDVSKLIVEVSKSTQIVETVVENGNKVFIFTNHGSHIDCRIVGVRTERLFRLVK
jgi:phosphoheptose isomerase